MPQSNDKKLVEKWNSLGPMSLNEIIQSKNPNWDTEDYLTHQFEYFG